MKEKAKVICPYCGRKHSMETNVGDIRKEIHCRCKDFSKHHTLILWVPGAGYQVFDENMEMIPVMNTLAYI